MLHRQLTDEMNLELEQRRTDFEKRSRQLEDQSRFDLQLNIPTQVSAAIEGHG